MYYTLLRSEDLLNSEAGEGVYAPDQSGEHDKESKSDQCVLNHFLGSGPDHLFNLGNHLAWETNYGSGRATFRSSSQIWIRAVWASSFAMRIPPVLKSDCIDMYTYTIPRPQVCQDADGGNFLIPRPDSPRRPAAGAGGTGRSRRTRGCRSTPEAGHSPDRRYPR